MEMESLYDEVKEFVAAECFQEAADTQKHIDRLKEGDPLALLHDVRPHF